MKVTKQERYDEIMKAWARHASIPYQWPHDEPWEKWFPEIILLTFERMKYLEKLVDNLNRENLEFKEQIGYSSKNSGFTAPPDLD